jgi:hypothetical protein
MRYRDKFVAHLDSDAKMDIPRLTAALAPNSLYHEHIVTVEADAGDLFWAYRHKRKGRASL